jgi:hypothetical protein
MVSNVSMKLFASSYSPGTQVSTTNNTTDRHDITEILLKVVLNTINLTPINLYFSEELLCLNLESFYLLPVI